MKWTLLIVLCVAIFGSLHGQVHLKESKAINPGSIHIASEKTNKLYIAPPARLKSAGTANSSIEVTYIGFPENAKAAFDYAVSIWARLITSPVPVRILARWDYIEGNALAVSRPSAFYNNFEEAPLHNVYYPVALAEKITGKEMNAGSPDVICTFNNSYPWYFGTDGNTPVNCYDFVGSALHEITHGLGISGFLEDSDGNGFFDNDNKLPSIYDFYILNSQNQQLADKSIFKSPSSELHHQLISEGLKFFHPDTKQGAEETLDWLYAPTVWENGVSIYHFPPENESLMSPFACKGEAIHNPDRTTMEVLSEIGWKSVAFEFTEIKDIEKACEAVPVSISFLSEADIDTSAVDVFYSTDNFATKHTEKLRYDPANNRYYGQIQLDYQLGNIQYYFRAKTTENQIYRFPAQAPVKKFSLRVGSDCTLPEVKHLPLQIVPRADPELNFEVFASDNTGIKSVRVEYKINNADQEPVFLTHQGESYYQGQVNLSTELNSGTNIEYRIIAVDQSEKGNIRALPAEGYYRVHVFGPRGVIREYSSEFDPESSEFVLSGFDISTLPGFTGQILHTETPYPVSPVEKENCSLLAQFVHPIIVAPDGKISFDEVVLVEPAENHTYYTEKLFCDYVIVEASKNSGKTWLPLVKGYDSRSDSAWYKEFNGGLKSNISNAAGNEKLMQKRVINITGDTGINEGDTVVFRFRLSSDNLVNGWGWAIKNLEIQKNQSVAEQKTEMENRAGIYPNPFNSSFYVDCSIAVQSTAPVQVTVTDLFGKVFYQESVPDISYNPILKVDLSKSIPGIYLVNISDGKSISSTKKMIKY